MYAEKLEFEGKKYRTPKYNEDLSLILNEVKGLEQNEKGQSSKKRALSFGVDSCSRRSKFVITGLACIDSL